MGSRAQIGLEYLITYGWALVIVATVVGVLAFIVGSPEPDITFSSSNPTKIMFKSGNIDASGNVEVVAQNITGGLIRVSAFHTGGAFVGSKLNGVESAVITTSDPVEVSAGSELRFTEIEYIGLADMDGIISIEYTDFAGLQRTTVVIGKRKGQGNAKPIDSCQTLEAGEKYVLTQDLYFEGSGQTIPHQACFKINGDYVVLNCNGKKITGSENNYEYGIHLYKPSGDIHNATIVNCEVSNFMYGIYLYGAPESNINNNKANDNSEAGIYVFNSENSNLIGNEAHNNQNYGIWAKYSNDLTVRNNRVSGTQYQGFYMWMIDRLTFTGNEAYNNTVDGIALKDVDQGTVRNNAATNNQNYNGIILTGTNGTTVKDNTATGNGSYGIRLYSSNNNIIMDNTVTGNGTFDNQYAAIYIQSGSGNTVNGNFVCNNLSVNDIYCLPGTVSEGNENTATNIDCSAIAASIPCS